MPLLRHGCGATPAAYARGYAEAPAGAPDEWGDFEGFLDAARLT
ncbi:hypothetical protein [Marihabitans asiaticum]|nr:hypothetical protein [Marihabitans asiaticum]